MSTVAVVGYCLVAFGIGYAGGSVIRIIRRSIEVLE
jgi:quinol-cytochrome oxidoreductase complex cytochrome b subunit